ncbi:FAD-binding oxidoreductase [Balneolaceae bacterium YR4-1]|uniref:FAD-binding oxidoreductase n=1 Tax=Halalkalibaculum roseum TaxID=2709311 RepID=A0A6M1SLI0_9BACT|nr:FAD-binding oxidoreductase [Halalkalibaculum roseum]NGP76191.1 FAD-binding oxidoreductase [Halalkalibaculum roseum]
MSPLKKTHVEGLKKSITGRVISPQDKDYDEARTIWNSMIDKKPAVIVQVAKAGDVPHAVRFAREHQLELSVLGGGHHIAGNSLAENGLTIDFSNMRKVTVDTQSKRARVEPGATLADFDKATLAHGLATPTGINSTTGIAGLTLGGGFGWLTRQYGMTIDNLLSARIVTAEGKTLKVSENENSDLFWAIRGGGGNFGVVTEFEYQLHNMNPEVYAGLIVFPFIEAKNIMKQYREFSKSAPKELNVWIVIRHAPPLPFLPEDQHGKMVIVLAVFFNGSADKGESLTEFLKGFGNPIGDHIGMQPYTQWQQAFDPLLTPGMRNYWKSHNFRSIENELIDTVNKHAATIPTPHTEIFLGSISGVQNDIPANATAYSARDARYIVNVHGRWEKPEDDKRCISWCRKFFDATKPFASGGAYVNFMTEDESERVPSAYGANYERLVSLKQKYDPDNLFHMNQNIVPEPLARK